MKKVKILLLFIFLSIVSCTEDCEIDSAKISELSNDITELRALQSNAISQALIDNYESQIVAKQNEITDLSNACN